MSSDRTSIFFTGATGYIGGSVLQRILNHPRASTFDITALVRDSRKAKLLETKFGLKVVEGSLDDTHKLTEQSENAHIVIHTADCDHEPAMKAILAGLKKRHERLGELPILIHTSGAAVLMDDARGQFTAEKVVSDLDLATLDALPSSAPHHVVDLLAISADTEGYALSYLVFPGLIFGTATGPFYDAGISKTNSIAIPWMAAGFFKRGRAGIVGTGASVWANVHIDDTAEFYYLLFDAVLSDPTKLGHGREGYYFVAADECKAYDIIKGIGEALVDLGRADNAEPTELTPEERVQIFGSEYVVSLLFSNARCSADRGRQSLGWKPKYGTKDLIESIHHEVEVAAKKQAAAGN
ncbi:NAD-P-binding protein [Polyporus arcularius HHB13444]|uniref:NAD-P-binding protein n=1 Tax=Polyporus arcularius HHB13444 TaxID=1314778 RepID=A0A5C3PPB2_9APHY|nr:NAD-P-binding protein [Polyporus arcularius HHB13444]